ncbi:hypothetical protein LY90DRAFT_665300 [Neocallimastix californiae]|uniref:Uncharacterized protein n=1 Tax=Neocallimastix californiae TaxID=1754190 RepID=A0A1Y2F3J1_9FUNG|nr:hypothetical protein LY90DRAFT_665300 [Neocallimastix californiae]|eukprot:ORY77525.1 hypothetical protein LY90DRAFT_665300 [Neocallimastix californiae]
MTDNSKPHIDTSQVAVSVNINTPQSALSPLPNVPTFIKLFGQPETKEDKNNENDVWDDKINNKPKSEILDIIDANDEDPFTLESFISLIMLYVKNKKDFIISRVKTADPNDEEKFYYSYYAAHHINKVIFRTQPEQSLLHRMRAKNPLNNMTIVGDVYYYVVKYEEAKKVIGNIKSKLKLEDLKQPEKIPLSPLAPRSIQRLLVRTGMAPLQAYPELMTRNNLRLIMKPEGFEPDPIIQSATISNDEFNKDDLFQSALTENQQRSTFLSRIKSSMGKKKDKDQENGKNKEQGQMTTLNDNYGSSVALLSDSNNKNNDNTSEALNENKENKVISPTETATNIPKNNTDESSSGTHDPSIKTDHDQYNQYIIDLGNVAMTSDKITSPKSAISSCPYPAYSKNLLQIHTTSYLNDRESQLNVYDWIKVHSTSPLSATTAIKIDSLFSKKFNNKTSNDGASTSTDETKNAEKDNNNNNNSTCITIKEDEEKENSKETDKLKNDKEDILSELKEIIFEAPFYATDDDFLMKSSVRAYFKNNALEPDDAVLFTLPSLTDNIVMLDGEQHPALLNFNYVLDHQLQSEARYKNL